MKMLLLLSLVIVNMVMENSRLWCLRDDSAGKEISNYVGSHALVLTIVECKGLDFQVLPPQRPQPQWAGCKYVHRKTKFWSPPIFLYFLNS
jgi:hypothetical protein